MFESKLVSFLLPLCHVGAGTHILEKVGANPIFDHNVIGLVAQFAVSLSNHSYLSPPTLKSVVQQDLNPCFLLKWGSNGRDPGQFNYPRGVAVLDRGHPIMDLVFVADAYNDRIQSFRGDGTPVKQWGEFGKDNGQFFNPRSVAVHSGRNHIFVADCQNCRIQVFDVDGAFVRKWGSLTDRQFHFPSSVAILARSQDQSLQNHSAQDRVYVADNIHIHVFSLDGLFLLKWRIRDESQFDSKFNVAVHPTRDLIFVADESGYRIQTFRRDGTFLFKWGSQGKADGQFQCPAFLAIHPTRDLLLVTECFGVRVQVFDLDGTFICKWDQADGQNYYSPLGIAVHPTKDMVYISDEHRIQAFSLFPTIRKRKRISSW